MTSCVDWDIKPQHNNNNNWAASWQKQQKWKVRPAKTQITVWSESSLSEWRNIGPLSTYWAHSEDWSDSADALADLSLCYGHTVHFVGFVTRQLSSEVLDQYCLHICPST